MAFNSTLAATPFAFSMASIIVLRDSQIEAVPDCRGTPQCKRPLQQREAGTSRAYHRAMKEGLVCFRIQAKHISLEPQMKLPRRACHRRGASPSWQDATITCFLKKHSRKSRRTLNHSFQQHTSRTSRCTSLATPCGFVGSLLQI